MNNNNKTLQKTLYNIHYIFKFIAFVWLGFCLLLFVLSVIRIFINAENFFAGWEKFAKEYSPFNIVGTMLRILFILPSLIAYKISDYFKAKTTETHSQK